MKTIYFLILYIVLFPFSLWSQNNEDILTLIDALNNNLNQYAKLSPFGSNYVPIDSLNLSETEIKELVEEANYDANLTLNKDSIDEFYMIFYFQDEVIQCLENILNHPDFEKYDIRELIKSDELSIIKSSDGKIYNFTMDEKMGGTYRSRISIMHFTDLIDTDSLPQNVIEDFFATDGYNGIYAINTKEGTKYVLTGYVRGCSYCFETFVQLISIRNNQFYQDFYFSTTNRDWDDGVFYDPETNTINVDYYYDDLTYTCSCNKDSYSYIINSLNGIFEQKCKCKYVFNGNNFECTEGSVEKRYRPKAEFPEIVSFKIAKNNKEVKLITDTDSTLHYLYLNTDSIAELNYPTYMLENEEFYLNQTKDTLTFNHGKTVYQIYETRNKELIFDVGILVKVKGKTYNLKGDKNTLKGSISTIERLNNVK